MLPAGGFKPKKCGNKRKFQKEKCHFYVIASTEIKYLWDRDREGA
jgi:hypothetical protein